MERRTFGRSGMRLSILGFGCGAVGGLMVRGDPGDQERAIARALDAGVNYFDTAVQYGDGESEKNLGRVLAKLKPADIVVGTKVRLKPADIARIGETVTASLEASLQRLGREHVDIFHLHNSITATRRRPGAQRAAGARRGGAGVRAAAPAGQDALSRHHRRWARPRRCTRWSTRTSSTAPRSATTCSIRRPPRRCRRTIRRRTMGACSTAPRRPASVSSGIRVLAGGALSGSAERHPIASPPPAPIGSAMSYDADVARAGRLMPLVAEGFAASLPEAAIRFAISHPAMGTILVGMASPQQFEDALAAVEQGPLPQAALDRLATLQQGFAGEPR